MAKKKWFRKLADPLGLPDPMDVYGEKAAAAEKSAKESAAQDKKAIESVTPAAAPTMATAEVAEARDDERKRKASMAGQNSTILTGASGLTGTTGGGKTLLGQ